MSNNSDLYGLCPECRHTVELVDGQAVDHFSSRSLANRCPGSGQQLQVIAGTGFAPACSDSVAGFDRAPDRYTGQDRETIDRMRDQAAVWVRLIWQAIENGDLDNAADIVFAYHCAMTGLKYEDRAGRKGPENHDLTKADWYRGMELHIMSGGEAPDPRENREVFVPYKREGTKLILCTSCRGPTTAYCKTGICRSCHRTDDLFLKCYAEGSAHKPRRQDT